MKADALAQHIEAALPGAKAEVYTRDTVHFDAIVTCACFEGMSKLEQQRKVMNCVQDLISSGDVHAFSLKTKVG
jgi:acid stress-induced BolA-like protein IbaG/YrbA